MGFTGLSPAAVALLAIRLRLAASALEDAAADAAAAASLSDLDDEGTALSSRTYAGTFRQAAFELDGRADYLDSYRMPAIDQAQDLTPTPDPSAPGQNGQPVDGQHFMDQIIWFLASSHDPTARPGGAFGTRFWGSLFADALGAALAAGWDIDIRTEPGGEVVVTFGNDAQVSLSNGVAAGDGALSGQLHWTWPVTWALPGAWTSLLPNQAAYSQTYRFASQEEFEKFWKSFESLVTGGDIQAWQSVDVGFATITFQQMYLAQYGKGPVDYTLDLTQQLSLLGSVNLKLPIDRLLAPGTLDPATSRFLADFGAAVGGEASAQLNYGLEAQSSQVPGYHVPGTHYDLPLGYATTVWITGEADLGIKGSARVLLFGEAIGEQIDTEVRAGLVLDRWGEPQQIVLRATVSGYQFIAQRMFCVPLANDAWLKITANGVELIPASEPDVKLGLGDGVVRIIEFERTINLQDARAMALAEMTNQLKQSGLDRLNIAIGKDPSLQAKVDEARAKLEELLTYEIPDEQWEAILEQTMRAADWPADGPDGQIAKLVEHTPLSTIDPQSLVDWAKSYLNPIAEQTGNSHWGRAGLTDADYAATAQARVDAMGDADLAEYLAANGVGDDGWDITTYEGTQSTQSVTVDAALAYVQQAAGYINGGLNAYRLDYVETGRWHQEDWSYQNLIALFDTAPNIALQLLQVYNAILRIPPKPFTVGNPPPAP